MKKEFLKILPLFLLTVVLSLAVALMPTRKSLQEKAAFAGNVSIELSPITANIAPGEEKAITVTVKNPGLKKITYVDLRFSFDKNILEIKDFTNSEAFSNNDTSGNAALLGNGSGAGRILVYNSQSALALPNSADTIVVGTLTIKGKAAGTSPLNIVKEQSQVVIENPNSTDLEMQINTTVNSTIVVSGEVSQTKVNVKLDPATLTKVNGQEFDIDVKVEAGALKVGFMQLGLEFDKDKLQIVSFTPNSTSFSADGFTAEQQDLGNSNGQTKLLAINTRADLPTGNFTAGKIRLKGKAAGINSLTIKKDSDSTYFAGLEGDTTKIFTLGTTQDGSYTITASSNTPVLNFKIKFQGVNTKRVDQKVKVVTECKEADGTIGSDTFSDINVSANDSGIYSGSVVLPERFVQLEPRCVIFIKGPKHLAKKFCENNQEARCSAGKSILLRLTNDLDFSKLPLEAGDLPNPNENNEQDGVANSVDFSLIEARLGRTDTEVLAVADLDLNGIINWGDANLLLQTLGTRYEDEN